MSFYVAAESRGEPPVHPVDEVLAGEPRSPSTAPSTCSRSTRAR